jgi:hypothetical protein
MVRGVYPPCCENKCAQRIGRKGVREEKVVSRALRRPVETFGMHTAHREKSDVGEHEP